MSPSLDEPHQVLATALKHRADSIRGEPPPEKVRERAFLYTAAGVLFFLSSYRRAAQPAAVSASPAASSASYKTIIDFLQSISKTVLQAELPLLSQLLSRVRAVACLQQSYASSEHPAIKKQLPAIRTQLQEMREQARQKQATVSAASSSAPLSSQRLDQLLLISEAVEFHQQAREQWKTASSLNFLLGSSPQLYGLTLDGLELNAVPAVMEYARRTLRDVQEQAAISFSLPVDLDAVDLEWKG